MAFGGATVPVSGTIVTDLQVQEAKRVLREYEIQNQKDTVSSALFKQATQAATLLRVSIAQDQKAIEASQQRQVTLRTQEQQARQQASTLSTQTQQARQQASTLSTQTQQARQQASGLDIQAQQARNGLHIQLQKLLENVNQREAAKLQQFLPQDPRRITFIQQSQNLKSQIADYTAKNQRGERVDMAALQNHYKTVFAQ
jgi:hypothetical protein